MSKFLQTSVLVGDLRTELIVQPFADRILVLVTQMGKVGNLIQASIPSTADLHAHTSVDISNLLEPLPSPPPAIQLTPIFGSAPSAHMQTLYSLYAAQIATLLWLTIGGEPRSVVVGIALCGSKEREEGEPGEREQQTFHAVMEALRTILLK
ncbi:hypothetical protein OG21DRAFT_1453175 [Imleria badia]|nr:hypothetical protein OG21DRAFT_1453175 [Imleria badia]